MDVIKFVNSVFNSNSYILTDGKYAVIVDIGDWQPIKDFILRYDLRINGLFITHTHYDHIYGIRDFMKDYESTRIFTSHFGKEALKKPNWNFSRYHDDEITIDSERIVALDDNDRICVFPKCDVSVMATPGHDKSCLTYRTGKLLFTGDSYIPGVNVVATFPNSNRSDALKWYHKLEAMSDTYIIYPGHTLKDSSDQNSKNNQKICVF